LVHFANSSDSEEDESADKDEDEDEELELQRELERIKAERAAAQAKKEREEKEIQDRVNQENAIKGNPLVDFDGNGDGSAKVTDDTTVYYFPFINNTY
jgi:protein CWC15